jgi:cellulose synthase/poly-beta-1,6-N-acetylglucosamine synthase-like glycosyltransferase
MNYPKVSILVAARNEEDNITDLLFSFKQLSYPKDKLQILIGDDDSTDATAEIIEKFTVENIFVQYIKIEKQIADLKGKANVLAQLAHLATGELFFFTDADIEVPKNWIEAFVAERKNEGVTVGLTLVKNKNWFEASQAIEWLFTLKLMKTLADFKIISTGMGNNMMVSAEAYWAVGGYEKIGFSIVEDYAIYKAIIDKTLGDKINKMVYADEHDKRTKIVQVEKFKQNRFCLDDIRILQLASWTLTIENYYSNKYDSQTI